MLVVGGGTLSLVLLALGVTFEIGGFEFNPEVEDRVPWSLLPSDDELAGVDRVEDELDGRGAVGGGVGRLLDAPLASRIGWSLGVCDKIGSADSCALLVLGLGAVGGGGGRDLAPESSVLTSSVLSSLLESRAFGVRKDSIFF